MRTAIAILIMFSLSFQTMVKVAIVGWYELNKDYIAKNLCENRDKPKMKCCGKCYLRKQLKKAEDGNEANGKQGPVKLLKVELAECLIPESIWLPSRVQVLDRRQYNAGKQHMRGHEPATGIFHPPAIA